jgi:hypothetical protein
MEGESMTLTEVRGTCDNLRMSEEDLILAKGKTLDEYERCGDRLRTLEGEAERTAKFLEAVVAFLRKKTDRYSPGELEVYLTEKVRTLMHDLHHTRNEYERLDRLVNPRKEGRKD